MKKLLLVLSLSLALLFTGCGSSDPVPQTTAAETEAAPADEGEWSPTVGSYDELIEKYQFANFNEMLANPIPFMADVSHGWMNLAPEDFYTWDSEIIVEDILTAYSNNITLFGKSFKATVDYYGSTEGTAFSLEYSATKDLIQNVGATFYAAAVDHFGQPEQVSIEDTDCTSQEFVDFLNNIPESSNAYASWSEEYDFFYISLSSYDGEFSITIP